MASIHDAVDHGNTMAYVHASYIKVTLGHTVHPSQIKETLQHTWMIDQGNAMAYMHHRSKNWHGDTKADNYYRSKKIYGIHQ